MFRSSLATALLFAAGSAFAQSRSAQAGTTLKLSDFWNVLGGFEKMKPKGEFETTAQFEARRQSELAAIGTPLYVAGTVMDNGRLIYDADAETYHVQLGLFHSINADFSMFGKVGASYVNNRAVNLYLARSGVGTVGVWEAKAPADEALIGDRYAYDAVVGSFAMPVAEARALKNTARIAIEWMPRAPYFASTIQNYSVKDAILIGDIRCAMVIDPAGKVLVAIPTK